MEAETGMIALQLYTLRDEMNKDVAATLHAVRSAGYETVETAFWPEHISLQTARQLLREAGLSVCSSHCSLPADAKRPEMFEIAETFECSRVIWHGWPEDERYKTEDGIKELTDIYNETSQRARTAGLKFGLHNHWWEFRNRVNGRMVYEIMLDHLDKDIFFELDTYWLKIAGHDPAKIITDFGGRAPLLHIKDGPARWTDTLSTEHEPQVALGKGSQDFPAILDAAREHVEWMVVEMDVCATDTVIAVCESYNYLSNLTAGRLHRQR